MIRNLTRSLSKPAAKVQGQIEKIQVLSDIPVGHKFALKDMDEGKAVIKYGEPIGQSTAKISRGEHPKG
jgi:altronate dehydratase